MATQWFFVEVFATGNSSGASYIRSASAVSVHGDGPLFQCKASVAGGITAAASSTLGECADGSDRKESVALDLGGEDAAQSFYCARCNFLVSTSSQIMV